jgi:hypothetical protein
MSTRRRPDRVGAAVEDGEDVIAGEVGPHLPQPGPARPVVPRSTKGGRHGAPAAGHGLDAEREHAHGQALADDLLLLRLVQLATGRVCGPSIPGISGGTAAGGSASAQLDDVDASAV